MEIGEFFYDEEAGSYIGDIMGGLALLQAVKIVPIEKKGEGPDYRIVTPHGELGAAWRKTSGKGNAYLSVQLDSPFFVAPVDCALVKRGRGEHVLLWNREEAETA